MNNLVYIDNNEAVCNSLQVAEKFHKQHKTVLRAIDNIVAEDCATELPQNCATKKMFQFSNYKAEDNQFHRICFMNRDGFSLLAMGFTGKDALQWKLQYIRAFNEMESFIREKCSPHWQQTRLESKSNRRMETDEIKSLVRYAKVQGSQNADKYYISYTKLANKAVGIQPDSRDDITINQLNNLILIEHIIGEVIKEGMEKELFYKDIYRSCKSQIEQFRRIAYLAA